MRVLKIDGEPWFVAADVCKALGYSHTPHALRMLDADEKNTVRLTDGNRGNPNGVIVNESGLYGLILKSERPEAKRFKKWVTGTVLPAIRKDGAYIMGEEKPPSFQARVPVRSPSRSGRPTRETAGAAHRHTTRQARQRQRDSRPALPGRRHPPGTPGTEAATSASPTPPAQLTENAPAGTRSDHATRAPTGRHRHPGEAGRQRGAQAAVSTAAGRPRADARSPTALPWLANADASAREDEAATT